MFEIILKEDFINNYIRANYEQRISNIHDQHDRSSFTASPHQRSQTSPFKSFNGSVPTEYSPYKTSILGNHHGHSKSIQSLNSP